MQLDPKVLLVIKRRNGAIMLKPKIARRLRRTDTKNYEELRQLNKNNRANIVVSS